MVRGVNKTVIEVNNTGSKIFDRVVFYVSPTYSNLSQKNLNKAIKSFTLGLDERVPRSRMTLRQRHILRRRVIIATIVGGLLLIGTALAIIL
ncbi:MAG: hypothetical protein IJZ63_00525 [Clostridia bacterium]|nr:hypothetical protein [Clostridia bacterium]